MRRLHTVFIALLVALMTGCRSEPASPIVERVKRGGAGAVESASPQSLAQWIGAKGAEYADSLWTECEARKKTADATWADSTEGRVCSAAYTARINAVRPPPPRDPRKY
jgi:hypothetical protein